MYKRSVDFGSVIIEIAISISAILAISLALIDLLHLTHIGLIAQTIAQTTARVAAAGFPEDGSGLNGPNENNLIIGGSSSYLASWRTTTYSDECKKTPTLPMCAAGSAPPLSIQERKSINLGLGYATALLPKYTTINQMQNANNWINPEKMLASNPKQLYLVPEHYIRANNGIDDPLITSGNSTLKVSDSQEDSAYKACIGVSLLFLPSRFVCRTAYMPRYY